MMVGKTIFEKQVLLVGCTIRIYYDARTYERQINKDIYSIVHKLGGRLHIGFV